jgi:hypothetical protein
MNVNDIKNGLSRSFGRTGLKVQKHSPEILLGVGLIGMVVTVVMASKATLKIEQIVVKHYDKMDDIKEGEKANRPDVYSEQDAMKDKAKLYVKTGFEIAKLYGPSIGVGVLSISAILASHGIMHNRQVALVAAYNILNEGFKSYRDRVAAELGAEVEKDYFLGLQEESHTETVKDEEGNKTKVKRTNKSSHKLAKSIYSRFFDESNPNYQKDRQLNKAFLISQQNYFNDVLVIRGHVFLNEVYEALGFPHTQEGSIVGWVLRNPKQMKEEGRDGYIDFGIFEIDNDPGREFVNLTNPTILLDFNVDGIVFNLI